MGVRFEDEASQPFLDQKTGKFAAGNTESVLETNSSTAKARVSNVQFLFIHLLIFLSYSLAYIYAATKLLPSSSEKQMLPLPAREAIRWELRPFTTKLVDNPFAGAPREELDTAWHDMLGNDFITVKNEDLQALDLHSVQLADGSGAVASLGVYHTLHCLKKVRQMTYKEHYHAGKPEAAMIREQAHSDHCIEYIREYLMCKPDLSLVTLHWINNTAQHADQPDLRLPTTWDHSLHECANWGAIEHWAESRAFDLYRYDLLEEPPIHERIQ